MTRFPLLRAAMLVPIIGLAACASLPADRGRGDVARLLAGPGEPPALADQPTSAADDPELASRIAHPLDADVAVELAWRYSPRVQAHLADLGLAAADLFESGRLRNLRLSAGRMGGSDGKTTLGIGVVISDLLTAGSRARAGRQRWQAALADAAQAMLDEATATRADYYRYLGAIQVAAMRDATAEAADVSVDLARRFHAAGNISALQLAREEAAATLARTDAARARHERFAARMALAERLGLAGVSNRWRVHEQLPLPAASEPDIDTLLALAHEQRLDLAAARARQQASEHDAALARRWAWLGEIAFGFERETEDGQRESGPELAIELPLFRQGQGDRARATAASDRAAQMLARHRLAIEREVRTGVARLGTLRQIIDSYRQALIPQRETIVARELERYNFMLIGAFELIQARQQTYDAYQAYLEAIRDYWLAHGELVRAVGGHLPGGDADTGTVSADDLLATPDATSHDHHHHHGDRP